MPHNSLVDSRKAFERAKNAFEAAGYLRKQAKERFNHSVNAAANAQELAAKKKALLDAAKNNQDELHRNANVAREIAVKLQKQADEARKRYEDACGDGATQQAKARKKKEPEQMDRLGKAAAAAQQKADKAEKVADDAETERAVADGEVNTLIVEYQDLANVAKVDARERDVAEEAFDDAKKAYSIKKKEEKKTEAEVLSLTITADKLDDEWKTIRKLRRSRLTPTYLQIRVPAKSIDADAVKAINRISGGPIEQVTRERELRNLITQHGIATEVAAVTKELNRRRHSETQTRVLAATYFESLLYMMNDHSGDAEVPKSTVELVQEIKDTNGFVEAILIYQQESESGPLKRFALELIGIVSAGKKIEITDFERPLIADQLRARL